MPIQRDGRIVFVHAQDGQCQRLVHLAVEQGEHGHGTDHTVPVELGIVEAAAAGGLSQPVEIGAKAIPLRQQGAIEQVPLEDGTGQVADPVGTGMAGEVVAKDHRSSLDGPGEHAVIFRIGFGKDDVEAQDPGMTFIDDAFDQPCQGPAGPGPAPLFLQALFIDVDDQHPRLEDGGQPAQPLVMGEAVEGVHAGQRYMAQQHHDGHAGDENAQHRRPQPERAQQGVDVLGDAVHAAPGVHWLNWMMVPFSSMRS